MGRAVCHAKQKKKKKGTTPKYVPRLLPRPNKEQAQKCATPFTKPQKVPRPTMSHAHCHAQKDKSALKRAS